MPNCYLRLNIVGQNRERERERERGYEEKGLGRKWPTKNAFGLHTIKS
jgi:hypothetical protein